jgi:uncharacterized phage-associated protein
MMFRLDTRKAIEAAAIVLHQHAGKKIGRKRLLALLYMADRVCLLKIGRPIIGGKLAAMKYGPIHSEVYDLIKGSHGDQPIWSKFFENEGYHLKLISIPRVKALSRFEVGILNDISDKFMGMDDWDVAEETHNFEEYKKNYVEDTSSPISLEQIVKGVGRGKDLDTIREDAQEKTYLDNLFSEKT